MLIDMFALMSSVFLSKYGINRFKRLYVSKDIIEVSAEVKLSSEAVTMIILKGDTLNGRDRMIVIIRAQCLKTIHK